MQLTVANLNRHTPWLMKWVRSDASRNRTHVCSIKGSTGETQTLTHWNLIGRFMTVPPPVSSPRSILPSSSYHCAFIPRKKQFGVFFLIQKLGMSEVNPLNPELNPICYLLALLGAHHFLHISRIRVKLLTFRLLMSYIYGPPILDVSRSHTTTQHSR